MGLEKDGNNDVSRSCIVISDTHIGGKKDPNRGVGPNYDELSSFFKWLRNIPEDGEVILVRNSETSYLKEIAYPSRIILLGDILELWDPENGDRSNIIKQALNPFALLQSINCDKVYVVGNHDQDLYELADVLKDENGSLNVDSSKFEVHRKHYPEKVNEGEKIGKLKYAFLHGHQYDKVQITESISRKLNMRFDPLDIVQDFSNISMIKLVFKEKSPTLLYGVLAVMLIFWNYLQGILSSFLNFINTPLWMTWIFGGFSNVSWAFMLSFVVITPSVKFITYCQGKAWNSFKPKDKNVEQVIKEGYYREKDDEMDHDVEVVVFGHTHIAGSYYLKSKKRLFINTGAWVNENDGRLLNTFACIDEKGLSVLSWTGKEKDGLQVFEEECSYTFEHLQESKH